MSTAYLSPMGGFIYNTFCPNDTTSDMSFSTEKMVQVFTAISKSQLETHAKAANIKYVR